MSRPWLALALVLAALATGALAAPAGADAGAPTDAAVVSLVPGASVPAVAGLTVERVYRVFPGALVAGSPAALDALRRDPHVLGVYADAPLQTHLDQAAPFLGFRDEAVASAPSAMVAVVDSGIDVTHPAFAARVQAFNVAAGTVRAGGLPVTGDAHGTHVVGALIGNGAASPDARYAGALPAGRAVTVDLGPQFRTSTALAAFEWLLDEHEALGVRVVTNSWGRAGDVDGRFDADAPLVRASDALNDAGLVVVFSAGNRGGVSTLAPEALNPNVLTVGAVDATGAVAAYSGRGPALDAAGAVAAWRKPDVVAVGDQLVTATRAGAVAVQPHARNLAPTHYAWVQGSSFAAPLAAAAAAVVTAAAPDLTPLDVRRAVTMSARDLAAPGPDDASGAGVVDAAAALRLARLGATAPERVTRQLGAEQPADVVAALGSFTRVTPTPTVAGNELVAWVAVPAGAAAVDAAAAWTGPGAAFTGRVVDGSGRDAGPLRPAAGGLSATFANPAPGWWQVRVKPDAGFFAASVTFGAAVPADIVLHAATLVEALAPAVVTDEGTKRVPVTPLAAVGAFAVALALRRRAR